MISYWNVLIIKLPSTQIISIYFISTSFSSETTGMLSVLLPLGCISVYAFGSIFLHLSRISHHWFFPSLLCAVKPVPLPKSFHLAFQNRQVSPFKMKLNKTQDSQVTAVSFLHFTTKLHRASSTFTIFQAILHPPQSASQPFYLNGNSFAQQFISTSLNSKEFESLLSSRSQQEFTIVKDSLPFRLSSFLSAFAPAKVLKVRVFQDLVLN